MHTTSETRNGRFTEGEFSSTIYPIDENGPLYNGNVAHPGRVALSAKMSFPSLVSNEFGLELHKEGYALVLSHLELLQDDEVCQRAKQGIKELFKAIYRRFRVQFSGRKLRVTIKAIGLSIPAHWTLEYEDLYRKIIMETFNNFQGDIFFLTEAEALAHYMFRDHRELLISCERGAQHEQDQEREEDEDDEEDEDEDEEDDDEDEKDERDEGSEEDGYREQDEGRKRNPGRTVVLIMDFGGHNMNGCLIDIASGLEGEHPGFYHLTKAQGNIKFPSPSDNTLLTRTTTDAGGGSEQVSGTLNMPLIASYLIEDLLPSNPNDY